MATPQGSLVTEQPLEELELRLVLTALKEHRGYDFAGYAENSLLRRLHAASQDVGVSRISELIPLILYDDSEFSKIMSRIFVSVTEFFRDPGFFRTLRNDVIPYLRSFPRPKIWHAGCASGEEVYSLAMVLREEGLLSRTRIYATDVNLDALRKGKSGVYLEKSIAESASAYAESGGTLSLESHCVRSARPEPFEKKLVMMDKGLRDRITWSHHNLCSDGIFSEINLVLCRNTMIYFGKQLQESVLELLSRSLSPGGVLCLGSHESLDFSAQLERFEPIDARQRIYRRRPLRRNSVRP